jgi:TonB-dependent Receptor Plug Domain
MKFSFLVSFFFFSNFTFSQSINFSGFLVNQTNGEAIIGADVIAIKNQKSNLTNSQGFFSCKIESSDTLVEFAFIAEGFFIQRIYLTNKNKEIPTIIMIPKTATEIDEVEIIGVKKQTDLSLIEMPIQLLKRVPNINGEADVIKALQLMPGVKGGKEGTSGLYVRGGTPDQNLFLLDNVPIYYVSHIGGFISTFDPNAINSIKLYKGNFPARYDGRLSSVVDLRMKNGNRQKTSGEIAAGVLSTKFQIEGPLPKDSTWTYLFSIRRFNIDLFTRLIARINSDGESSVGYTFYDLNTKFVKQLKNNGKISFGFYSGRDRIFFNASKKASEQNTAYKYKSNVKWGNILGSFNFSKPIKISTMMDVTLATTNFNYTTDVKAQYSADQGNNLTKKSEIEFNSGVNDILFKTSFDTRVNSFYSIFYGINNATHFFTTGKINYSGYGSVDTLIGDKKITAYDNSIFIENNFSFSNNVNLSLGINGSSFNIEDTSFYSMQPRFLFGYKVSDHFNLQFGYARMVQYMHYLTNSGAGLPSDLWIPVSKQLLPEVSNQYTAGIKWENIFEKFPVSFSLETFYKNLSNLIDYKEGATVLSAEDISSKVVANGMGKIYGVELLLQHSKGRSTGWIAYTWSKNTRTFSELNEGHTYPFKYDRRHDISVVFAHNFTENIKFTSTWEYSTGAAITLAQGKYNQIDLAQYYTYANPTNTDIVQGYQLNQAQIYNGKNGYRLPSYHKLDVGIGFAKKRPQGIRTWNISIYNLYNQQNPFFLFYKKNSANQVKLNQLALFPIIPSASYTFTF